MNHHLETKLTIPGIHALTTPGLVGDVELIIEVPPNADQSYLAILGHPHSLQGGTMHNKVVTTMAKSFREQGIASLRFNFRGVGGSAGEYAAGIGESEDMLYLLNLCNASHRKVFFAGFSFGSYVAYRALTQYQLSGAKAAGLISIAPPVHHYDYNISLPGTPWLVVMGDEDDVVPPGVILDFFQTYEHNLIVERFADSGHFFHGKLGDLKAVLHRVLQDWMLL